MKQELLDHLDMLKSYLEMDLKDNSDLPIYSAGVKKTIESTQALIDKLKAAEML